MTHTPGKWTQDRNLILDDEGEIICELSYRQNGYVRGNAALIEAAPETLEALRMFVAQYEGNGHDERELRPEMIAARAAIAKAERKES